MKTVTAKKRNSRKRRIEFTETMKSILQYTAVAIGGLILLMALYQIFQYLFVAAVLFIAWLFPKR